MSKVITPEAILSYPQLFEARSVDGSKAKFSCALVFLEGTDLKALKDAVTAVGVAKYGADKFADMVKRNALKLPFRKGEEKSYPDGSIFINVRSDQQPGVVDRVADPKTGKPRVITDEREIYAGCRVRASINAYCYDTSGNKGITFGLNNVQKLGDGERLDGKTRAEDDFTAEAPSVENAAGLDGLLD